MKTIKLTIVAMLLSNLLAVAIAGNTSAPAVKTVKTVFIFDNSTGKLVNTILWDTMAKNKEAILKKYKSHSFFGGYLNSVYREKDGNVLPAPGSDYVIYRDKNIIERQALSGNDIFPIREFPKNTTSYYYYEAWPCKWKSFIVNNNKTSITFRTRDVNLLR